MSPKIIAVIPARGGSKGIPKKNLEQINGISLVGHAVQFALRTNLFDSICVSTDSTEISLDAKKNGCGLVINRPTELSGDTISDQPVLRHALLEAENLMETKFDILVMLQPTSPIRSTQELTEGIKRVIYLNHDSAWSVKIVDLHYHPRKQFSLLNGTLINYVSENLVTSRHLLDPTYARTGCFYVYKREVVLNDLNLMGNSCSGVISDLETVNIDTYDDLLYLRKLSDKSSERLFL